MRPNWLKSNVIVVNVPPAALEAPGGSEVLSLAAESALRGARLVLDLSHLETIDSAGIRALFSLFRQVNAAGGELKICNLNRRVRAFFFMARLDRVFEIHRTKAEAIRSFRQRDKQR